MGRKHRIAGWPGAISAQADYFIHARLVRQSIFIALFLIAPPGSTMMEKWISKGFMTTSYASMLN